MKNRKTYNADAENKKNLFLLIGLTLSLALTLFVLEYRSYESGPGELGKMSYDDEDEIAIITNRTPPPPPPPPPPPAPEVIEVVEDEEEVEETVIESTETNEDEIIEVEEVEIEEEFEDVDVPFAVIEDVPIFPGCEKVAKSERRKCFQENMNKHIRRNFRYPEIAQEMGIQGRVYVNFIIAKDGSISNIRMRGPDKNLEKEAQRIISKLPSMTPGKQRGRAVRVPFSIPITFRLQ